jgi:2'-5' RNA ligase
MKLDFLSQRREFDAVWERRHSDPLVLDSWVDSEWANGRSRYVTFLVKVDDPMIIKRVQGVQDMLARFGCVQRLPSDYLHLTVKETGCFLVEAKTGEDEITGEEVGILRDDVQGILEEYGPFSVKLGRLNNFNSVVCVEGHDGGVLREINRGLREGLDLMELRYDPVFLPHMSITSYRSEQNYPELIDYLEKNRDKRVGELTVKEIKLVIAHLPDTSGSPRLETVETYPLKQ